MNRNNGISLLIQWQLFKRNLFEYEIGISIRVLILNIYDKEKCTLIFMLSTTLSVAYIIYRLHLRSNLRSLPYSRERYTDKRSLSYSHLFLLSLVGRVTIETKKMSERKAIKELFQVSLSKIWRMKCSINGWYSRFNQLFFILQ